MTASGDIQIVVFRIGGQELGFEILQVERVLRYEPPTPLPQAPPFLEGVTQFDGETVAVIDLRKRFEVPAPIGEETRLVILRWETERVALVVDDVREVLRIERTSMSPPGATVSGLAAPYIAGIVACPGRTIIMLNAARILTSTERLALVATGLSSHG